MDLYMLSDWAGDDLIYAADHEMYDIHLYIQDLEEPPPDGSNVYKELSAVQESSFDTPYVYNLNRIHAHHDFVEFFYVLSGTGVAFFNDTKRMVQHGDLVCVHVGDQHSNFPLPQVKVCNCLISTSLIQENGPLFQPAVAGKGRLSFDPFTKLSGNTLFQVEELFQQLLRESQEKPPYYADAMLSYVNQLLICLCRFRQESKSQQHYHRTISPILDYVSDHFRTVTLGDLAQFSSYNPTYLSKLFHDTLGVNFTEYVNRLRIDEAVKLVLQSNMTIDEICQNVGFKSRLHFYEVFKKHTGFTPGALRKR